MKPQNRKKTVGKASAGAVIAGVILGFGVKAFPIQQNTPMAEIAAGVDPSYCFSDKELKALLHDPNTTHGVAVVRKRTGITCYQITLQPRPKRKLVPPDEMVERGQHLILKQPLPPESSPAATPAAAAG